MGQPPAPGVLRWGPPVTGRSRLSRRRETRASQGRTSSSSSPDISEKTSIYSCVTPLPFSSRVQKNKTTLVLPLPPSRHRTQGV